ncbi:MAG: MFS transporter [Tenericutes bacterium]|jgi:MFS family permease|nr:MFS transporter [Mycoplasmatota bacterium]
MKKTFVILILIYFIQGMIHNLGHPVTPAFVTNSGIPDYMFGVFYSTMSAGLVIGAPIWGIIADRGNKKTAMIIGLILYSLGQIGFGYSENMYWMVFFRFMSGFGVSATVTLFISHTIEISKPENRAKHLAWMAASLALGRSVGYWIGGFISSNETIVSLLGTGETSLERIFLIQAFMNLIHAASIYFFIKEVKKDVSFNKKPNVFQSFKNIKNINKSVLIFLISLIFMSIAFTNLSKYLDVFFNAQGYGTDDIGNYNLVIGIVGILTSIFIVPLVSKIKKNLRVLQVIQVTSIIAVLYVFRANNFILAVYSVLMIYIIGHAIFIPLEQNFIANQAKDGLYSTTMGIRQSFFSIGMVIGPLIGGFLFDKKPIYVFDFSALMMAIGFILLIAVNLRIKKEEMIHSQVK